MSGLLDVFRHEFRRIFTVKSAFAVMVLGAAFYALFYPQPYLNEALRNVPIALVDRDGTQSSRDFARRVDATPDVAITEELPDVASAEREVYARRVGGILVIPQYFERELLHGRPSPVALYADASYFLMYQRVAGGVAAVARTLGAEVEAGRLIGIGVDPALAVAATDPYLAEDALSAIDVEYELLPPVVSMSAALATNAPRLYDEWPDNQCLEWRFERGPLKAAFENAAHRVSVSIPHHRYTGTPLEGRAALANFDPVERRLTVILSTQSPHISRTLLAQTPFVKYKDAVRVLNGAQAVGDDQCGSSRE